MGKYSKGSQQSLVTQMKATENISLLRSSSRHDRKTMLRNITGECLLG